MIYVMKSSSRAKMGPLVLLHVVPTPKHMSIDTTLVKRQLAGRETPNKTHEQKTIHIHLTHHKSLRLNLELRSNKPATNQRGLWQPKVGLVSTSADCDASTGCSLCVMLWQSALHSSHAMANGKPPTIHHLVFFLIHPSPPHLNEVQNISHSPAKWIRK